MQVYELAELCRVGDDIVDIHPDEICLSRLDCSLNIHMCIQIKH